MQGKLANCNDTDQTPQTAASDQDITITNLFKYTEKLTTQNWKFSDKKNLIIFIFQLKT